MVKGEYYREEGWFTPHPGGPKDFYGVMEAVWRDGRLQMAEFNEFNSPVYYIRKYQNANKRYSDYAFFAGIARAHGFYQGRTGKWNDACGGPDAA